jgi:diguanylate cyclase (GGDEF)-like protein
VRSGTHASTLRALALKRVGRRTGRRVVALATGVAVLLAVGFSGASLSPLLPLVALWVAFARAAVGRPAAIAVAAVLAIAAIDAIASGVRIDAIAAAATVAALAALVARLSRPAGAPPAEAAPRAPFEQATVGASPARAIADLRGWIDARGVALWWVDAPHARARLVCSAGRRPPVIVGTQGSPLGWVAATGTAMQVEPAPDWVEPASALAAVRVGADAAPDDVFLLTLELRREREPSHALLACASAVVGAAIDADLRGQRHALDRERHERLLAALRELPRSLDAEGYARQLLDSARALTGASGAAIASWREDEGTIGYSEGHDGGPSPRTALDSPASEMALAARSRATIRRGGEYGNSDLPLAHRGEQWRSTPRERAAIPLWTGGSVSGIIAIWNVEPAPLDDAGIRMLEAIARVCGPHYEAMTRIGENSVLVDQDALTGLLNRRAFDRRFERETARAERYGRPISVIAIDIDHFKLINDRFGHEAGDAVLRRVAQTLQATVRNSDVAARVGGEEFVVLLPETGLHAAGEAAERLRAAVAGLANLDPALPCAITISLGVSALPECVVLPGRLRVSSDEALYLAKAGGRDRVAAAPRWVEKMPELR